LDRRSNSALHHPGIFVAGIGGPDVLPLLCQLSYSDLRRWQDSNPQPLVPDVIRAFTTPQTL